jgi:carbamoyltransferase
MPHISLGINLSHDAAAAICVDGEPTIAIASERLCRIKHGFPPVKRYHFELPWDAVCSCLDHLGIGIDDCDRIVLNKAGGRWDWSLPALQSTIPLRDKGKLVCLASHHEAHAEFSYSASGFAESLVLIIDRFGSFQDGRGYEAETAYLARDGQFELLFGNCLDLPGRPFGAFIPEHSLTALYQFVTIAYGFYAGMDECGKTMGLAPYGTRSPGDPPWIRLNDDFTLDCSGFYDDFRCAGLIDTSPMGAMGFSEQGPRRVRRTPYRDLTPDLAHRIQHETEEVVLEMLRRLAQASPVKNLCLGGGMFHNSVMNGKIMDLPEIKNVYVPPAPSDDGNAIGCAYRGCRMDGVPCRPIASPFLGRDYGRGRMATVLQEAAADFRECNEEELLTEVVAALLDGDVVGWFQGRSEFGFRALGHRSILADARDPGMRDYINRFVKHREEFRPLGAMVLKKEAAAWFSCRTASPYMMQVGRCLQPERIPAVVHVDYSTRIQTVGEGEGLAGRLLRKFFVATGVPVLINTSFNARGEPMVETPEDAVAGFLRMNLDLLAMGRFLIRKEDALV